MHGVYNVLQLFPTYLLTYIVSYLITYLLTELLTPWLYGPLTAFVPLITEAHSTLSNAFCHHILTFISCGSFSTPSSHLSLGLLLLVHPSGLLSYTSFTPSLINSYYMSEPFQSLIFNFCYYV